MRYIKPIFIIFLFLSVNGFAQTTISIGERGYYHPELNEYFFPDNKPYFRIFGFDSWLQTNLSLGIRRQLNPQFFFDFTYDGFYGRDKNRDIFDYSVGEYSSIIFRLFQLQGGYYIVDDEKFKLALSSGIAYRWGGVHLFAGYRNPNSNFPEPKIDAVQLESIGIPLEAEYSYEPIQWISFSLETGIGIFFLKEQTLDIVGSDIKPLVKDFRFNSYVGIKMNFHLTFR